MIRIDFFLISKPLAKHCQNAEIMESIHTNQKIIYIKINSKHSSTKRGPGFWKFNNSLLADQQYIDHPTDLYVTKREEYSNISDKRIFWDIMKYEIQINTIQYSKRNTRTQS